MPSCRRAARTWKSGRAVGWALRKTFPRVSEFLFGHLNSGGNEFMTKQRIGVAVVIALLAVAGLAQAPPAKQKPAAKKNGGAVSGGPVMPGSEQWMDIPAPALVGTPSVEMGGTLKIAILQGDPMTAGRSFTVRLSGTDGTKI